MNGTLIGFVFVHLAQREQSSLQSTTPISQSKGTGGPMIDAGPGVTPQAWNENAKMNTFCHGRFGIDASF